MNDAEALLSLLGDDNAGDAMTSRVRDLIALALTSTKLEGTAKALVLDATAVMHSEIIHMHNSAWKRAEVIALDGGIH